MFTNFQVYQWPKRLVRSYGSLKHDASSYRVSVKKEGELFQVRVCNKNEIYPEKTFKFNSVALQKFQRYISKSYGKHLQDKYRLLFDLLFTKWFKTNIDKTFFEMVDTLTKEYLVKLFDEKFVDILGKDFIDSCAKSAYVPLAQKLFIWTQSMENEPEFHQCFSKFPCMSRIVQGDLDKEFTSRLREYITCRQGTVGHLKKQLAEFTNDALVTVEDNKLLVDGKQLNITSIDPNLKVLKQFFETYRDPPIMLDKFPDLAHFLETYKDELNEHRHHDDTASRENLWNAIQSHVMKQLGGQTLADKRCNFLTLCDDKQYYKGLDELEIYVRNYIKCYFPGKQISEFFLERFLHNHQKLGIALKNEIDNGQSLDDVHLAKIDTEIIQYAKKGPLLSENNV